MISRIYDLIDNDNFDEAIIKIKKYLDDPNFYENLNHEKAEFFYVLINALYYCYINIYLNVDVKLLDKKIIEEEEHLLKVHSILKKGEIKYSYSWIATGYGGLANAYAESNNEKAIKYCNLTMHYLDASIADNLSFKEIKENAKLYSITANLKRTLLNLKN